MAPRVGHVFKPLKERLDQLSMPEPNSGCWLWIGATNGVGYGKISVGHSKGVYAHRASYELHCERIPDGMHLDHLCRVRSCINPDHLEPVTNQENTLRGAVSALRAHRHECDRGHELSITQYIDSQGRRQCRECLRIRQRSYYARKKNNEQS